MLFAVVCDNRPPYHEEAATEAVFHELFWNYAFAKSTVERADRRFDWFIQGSESQTNRRLEQAPRSSRIEPLLIPYFSSGTTSCIL
jgi:hypothetical protein